MSLRAKGQEVTILVVRDSVLEAELTNILNFNSELQLEVSSVGYLGEFTNRKDEVFRGGKFDFEMHVHSQDFLTFAQAVLDRATRKTPDTVFNITAVLAFPNGQTPTVLFPDVKFGAIPMNVPERGDFVKIKIEGEVEQVQMVLS